MVKRNDYILVKTPIGREFRHNNVMEKHINRELKSYEVVHHIDLIKYNDELSNLYLCENRSIHSSIHAQFKSIAKKITKALINIDVIVFDKEKGIYEIDSNKILNLNNISLEDRQSLLNQTKMDKQELSKILKRREELKRRSVDRWSGHSFKKNKED